MIAKLDNFARASSEEPQRSEARACDQAASSARLDALHRDRRTHAQRASAAHGTTMQHEDRNALTTRSALWGTARETSPAERRTADPRGTQQPQGAEGAHRARGETDASPTSASSDPMVAQTEQARTEATPEFGEGGAGKAYDRPTDSASDKRMAAEPEPMAEEPLVSQTMGTLADPAAASAGVVERSGDSPAPSNGRAHGGDALSALSDGRAASSAPSSSDLRAAQTHSVTLADASAGQRWSMDVTLDNGLTLAFRKGMGEGASGRVRIHGHDRLSGEARRTLQQRLQTHGFSLEHGPDSGRLQREGV